MRRISAVPVSPWILPLSSRGTGGLVQGSAVLLGTGILAAASWIHIPMYPVPTTLQTLAVMLIGAAFGTHLAALTVLAWLAEAAIGLPVLHGGASGRATVTGPTGGFLAGFVVVAALIGWLAERGQIGGSLVRTFALLLVGEAVIMGLGAAWLAHFTGVQGAWAAGVAPFLLSDVIKIALAAFLLQAVGKALRGRAV